MLDNQTWQENVDVFPKTPYPRELDDIRPLIMKTTLKLTVPHICLRSEPRAVSQAEAPEVFGVTPQAFGCNTIWRPREYLPRTFKDQGDVVLDEVSGLMWQKSGSESPLMHQQIQEYLQKVNQQTFAGHDNWRLPTVPELLSLLEPEPQANGVYLNPLFDAAQSLCWSADCKSAEAAWYLNFDRGYLYWGIFLGNFDVRLVRQYVKNFETRHSVSVRHEMLTVCGGDGTETEGT